MGPEKSEIRNNRNQLHHSLLPFTVASLGRAPHTSTHPVQCYCRFAPDSMTHPSTTATLGRSHLRRSRSNTRSSSTSLQDLARDRDASATRSRSTNPLSRSTKDLLLQTALSQNHHLKHNDELPELNRSGSTNNLLNHGMARNKNIPMVHEQPRPHIKRWNSITTAEIAQKVTENQKPTTPTGDRLASATPTADRIAPATPTLVQRLTPAASPEEYRRAGEEARNKASISPLTVLRDNYNVKRPETGAPPTDNSFQNLDPTKRNLAQAPSLATSSSTAASTTNKIYNKMSHLINIAHNSMHSLVPMAGKLPNGSYNETVSSSTTKGTRPRYQSELDDDDDDEFHVRKYHDDDEDETDDDLNNRDASTTETQYNLELWDTPTQYITQSPKHQQAKGKRLQDILQEINDFQNDFVQKMNTPGTQATKNAGVNRTQQRVLDYRDLYEADGDSKSDSPSSLMVFKNKTNASPFGDSFNYSIKIQHDTILSDYTLIRLRFGSTLSSDESKGMRSHTGVLGFVNRTTSLNNEYKRSKGKKTEGEVPWYRACSSDIPGESTVNFDNKEAYLRDLWSSELHSLLSNSPPIELPALESQPQADSDVSHEDMDIYGKMHDGSISNMAKNVRLRN